MRVRLQVERTLREVLHARALPRHYITTPTMQPGLRGRAKALQRHDQTMALACQRHGKSMAGGKATTWQHGQSVAKACQRHGDIMVHDWQKGMATTWQQHGKSMAKAWQRHGKRMTKAWKRHGNDMSTGWQSHGNEMANGTSMATTMPEHGKSMSTVWQCQGKKNGKVMADAWHIIHGMATARQMDGNGMGDTMDLHSKGMVKGLQMYVNSIAHAWHRRCENMGTKGKHLAKACHIQMAQKK